MTDFITELAEEVLLDAFREDFDGMLSGDRQKLIEERANLYINSLAEMLFEERKQIIPADFLKWARINIPGVDIGKNSDSWSAVATNLVRLLVIYRKQLTEQEYHLKQRQFIYEQLEKSLLEGVLELKYLKKRSEEQQFFLQEICKTPKPDEPKT
ncbi:hypothetical protein [Roseofilum sp. Belize Diploria]|uniref:hypothetical protein n=1 Tax=Roseofilum sp. Belize Diploria TaxID=2821501 RepID=UPI001B04AFA8|nr:hypothetical protein [Roseofilum sp. Belize Diploria]MBP0011299.1 hypothetical protein [Roseofilum sp. Belize Diploria]